MVAKFKYGKVQGVSKENFILNVIIKKKTKGDIYIKKTLFVIKIQIVTLF